MSVVDLFNDDVVHDNSDDTLTFHDVTYIVFGQFSLDLKLTSRLVL